MKRCWMVIATVFCVLMLSACAPQENRNISTSKNDAIRTSENGDIHTGKNDDINTGKNGDIYTGENGDIRTGENNNISTNDNNNTQEDETEMKMNVQIGDYIFTATLAQNQAVNELVEIMKESPVTIEMSDYSGFEKVGPLGRGLTTDNHQTTTTEGDIVLYSGNQIVIFYGSNSWSYTRIGKIDDLTNWQKALGSGDITAVFTLAE